MDDVTEIRLPDGRTAHLHGDVSDLSVFGAVRATGDWEPDMGVLFQEVVKRDWVCVDIGANIGCHTMALAVLADAGEVIAFEASTANFDNLRANIAALAAPMASVCCEKLALWSSETELSFAAMHALAGCNFVTTMQDDAANERLIRSVVSNPALADHPLGLRTETVSAVTLDAWWERHGRSRLDLIKIDIEGAEIEAIDGARTVIRQFDPILITEYNPSCAVSYRGDAPRRYYDLLADVFERIVPIGAGGALGAALSNWGDLEAVLAAGPGWIDLCCTGARP